MANQDNRQASRRGSIKVGLFLVSVLQIAGASELGELADSMLPGTWEELSTIGLNDGLLEDFGGHHILQYTDDARWDPVGERMLFLGQGHSSNYDDDPNTPARFVSYDAASNTWTEIPQGIPSENVGHGYDHSALDEQRGEFFHRPFGSRIVYRYHLGADLWEALPEIPQSSSQVAGALEYFPEAGGLVFVDGDWGVWFWRRATNQWTLVANTSSRIDPVLPLLPMGPYHNFAEHSPVHHAVVFGGGNGSNQIYRLNADLSVTVQNPAPINLGIAWGSVFTLDPVSGNFLVFGADERVWDYAPDNSGGRWTQVTGSRPPFFDIGDNNPVDL